MNDRTLESLKCKCRNVEVLDGFCYGSGATHVQCTPHMDGLNYSWWNSS